MVRFLVRNGPVKRKQRVECSYENMWAAACIADRCIEGD